MYSSNTTELPGMACLRGSLVGDLTVKGLRAELDSTRRS